MADPLQFSEIYGIIKKYLAKGKGTWDDIIKDTINMVYLNEMLVADELYPLYWLLDFDDSRASVASQTITAITNADPGVITTSGIHGLAVGDLVSIHNISGMTELNNRFFKVNTVPTVYSLSLIDLDGNDAIDSTSFTAWTSGGTVHHRGITLGATPTGANVEEVKSVIWHDEDVLEPAAPDELEKNQAWFNDSTARPEKYLHLKRYTAAGAELNFLVWFQGADAAYDLRYWYIKRPARLSGDTDRPLLPPKFHTAIAAGALTRLAEYNVQVENAIIWPNIYLNQLKALTEFNRKWWKQHEENKDKKPYLL